ncbi:MAG TPA: hypothetical protein H9707_03380 [Candidatus Butyricicoccus avicola]|nr:hypothetical protein [Candidatus Butyricicoccus avicola]
MYNEYLQDAVPEPIEQPPENRTPAAGTSGGGLLQLLADRLGGAKLDADTLVAIAVIWFLLSDGKALDTDLLIIIGVLLLLGI